MKSIKKWIAFLLVACCVLTCAVGCCFSTDDSNADGGNTDVSGDNGNTDGDNGNEDGGNTDAPTDKKVEIGDIDTGSNLGQYVIVYGSKSTPELNRGLAEKLRDVIKTNCGVTLSVVSDSTAETQKEILVGSTSRAQSKYFFEGKNKLELMECVIGTVEGKIVVTGALLFSTEEAILLVEKYAKENSTLNGMPATEKDLHTSFTSNKGEYRLMEYNVLVEYPGWGVEKVRNAEVEVRKEAIASMIKGYSPDVAVLCEVFDTWSNQLPELIQDEYALVQWKRSNGSSNRTPIIYKKERFNLLESGCTDIGVKNESSAEEKYKNYRCVTYAVLQDKTTGEKLAVFGTHLESTNESDRLAQIPKIKPVVDSVMARHSTATITIMGDFNTAEYKSDNRAYVEFENTFSDLKNPVKSHAFASIQQIFVSKTATVNKTTIEANRYATVVSDHKPVIVDITIN